MLFFLFNSLMLSMKRIQNITIHILNIIDIKVTIYIVLFYSCAGGKPAKYEPVDRRVMAGVFNFL